VDMNFAKNNIEGLRNYIKTNGKTNSDGDKYIKLAFAKTYDEPKSTNNSGLTLGYA